METPPVHITLTSTISPSKIVIVAIIAAYCSGVLPLRQNPSVLESIVKLINGKDDGSTDDFNNSPLLALSLDEILLEVMEAVLNNGSKKELLDEDSNKDAILIKKILLKILHSIDSSDTFSDFVRSSESMLVENPIEGAAKVALFKNPHRKVLTRTSFLGRFVHNIVLSFKYMEFEKAVLIWKAFRQYRDKSDVLEPSAALQENDNLQLLVLPKVDLSNLIEHQIYLLESFGIPTSPEVSRMLDLVAKIEPGSLPSSHYIKYLECLKDNDFEGSFENLHRYFDYMMSSKHRPLYHYALLSLATLYATFGCNQQAVSAIGEAIIVARENKDLTCLNYLLTWVYNFAKDRPRLELLIGKDYSDKQKILSFLKLRTKESKNKQFQAIFYQFRALQEINDGLDLPKIFEDLLISSYLSLYYDEESGSDCIDHSIFAKSCHLTSTLWLRLGVPALLEVYLDIGLESCKYQHNVYDEVSISIKKAYIEFYRENYDSAFKIFDSLEPIVSNNGSLFKILESRKLALMVRLHLQKENYTMADAILSKIMAQIDTFNDSDFINELTTLKSMLDEVTL